MNRYLRPGRPGLVVVKPNSEGGGRLKPEGEIIELNSFWRRRIKAKDVLIGKPKPEELKELEKSKSPKKPEQSKEE